MAKRMILMLLAAAAVIGALGFVKFRQIQKAMAQGAAFQMPPEAVTTVIAAEEKWPATERAIGTAAAVQGVDVSADLPGIVEQINFNSGDSVKKGDAMVQLDTRQEQAQKAAAEAALELAKVNFARLQGLVETKAIARADYDRADAELKSAEARLGEIKATIARKTISAPFSGIVGLREVNLGQYLAAGKSIVSLQALDPIYVNFGVPQQYIGQVRPGTGVRVTAKDGGAALSGKITAVNAVVDETTRNIQMQATLSNPKGALRPGMFVQTEIVTGATKSIVAVPASAINYAPYGDSVFVVTELDSPKGEKYKGVRQQFVKLGEARGDRVAITSGLKPGEEIVSSGVFKLRNGAAVLVNNSVQPSNELAPKPEDN